MTPYNIYCLRDPRDSSIFYIGATRMNLSKRVKQHTQITNLHNSKKISSPSNMRKDRIKEILNNGLTPIIELLEITDAANVSNLELFHYEILKKNGAILLQSRSHFTYYRYLNAFGSEGSSVAQFTTTIDIYNKIVSQPEKASLNISDSKMIAILIEEALNTRDTNNSKLQKSK